MREMIAELESGNLVKQSSLKLSDWVTQYLAQYKPNIEATTRAGYEEKQRNCIDPYIGKLPLNTLNNTVIQKWVNDLSASGKAEQTIRNAYNIVNSALEKAEIIGMISRNPCKGTALPKKQCYTPEVYNAEQIKAAINTARGSEMYLFVLLFFTLGLRRGEMCALRWDDVDLESNIVHVHDNCVIAGKEVITKGTKSKAGTRDISVTGEVVEALKEARRQYLEEKLQLGKMFHDGGFVIRKENGEPFRPDSLSQKWRRFLEKNDLPHIRLHDTRHSNATALIQAGVSPKVVQARLGHSDVSITLNTYTHVTEAMDKEAANKVNDLLSPQASNR